MKLNLFNQDFSTEPKKFAPAKGSERIQINNILSAISIAVIAILVQHPESIRTVYYVIFSELAASIPLLVTSSLLYSKICYRPADEYRLWNGSAWITHTIGYFLLIDSIYLLLYSNGFHVAAGILLGVTTMLIILYSLLDIYTANLKEIRNERMLEKIIKGVCYVIILYFGAIFPS